MYPILRPKELILVHLRVVKNVKRVVMVERNCFIPPFRLWTAFNAHDLAAQTAQKVQFIRKPAIGDHYILVLTVQEPPFQAQNPEIVVKMPPDHIGSNVLHRHPWGEIRYPQAFSPPFIHRFAPFASFLSVPLKKVTRPTEHRCQCIFQRGGETVLLKTEFINQNIPGGSFSGVCKTDQTNEHLPLHIADH